MKTTTTVSAAMALVFAAGLSGPALAANDAPLTEKWAPSEYGADDKVGAVNRTTAAMVLKAVKLANRAKSPLWARSISRMRRPSAVAAGG
ncbi:MAG: hypothetical protein O3B74_06190 [Proteobacteria bacterium]|nr:hypothetical protein [Pseudomonadota bacterium]MDA1309796.1 hypothetical protein [Pseudomonadota bacterium]